LRLQRSLTAPPLVFSQSNPRNDALRETLSRRRPGGRKGILTRDIKPSLWVGTRGTLSSAAAYALPHFGRKRRGECELNARLNFREVMTMGRDGASVGIDWEVPPEKYDSSLCRRKTSEERQSEILEGPIRKPVVLILHGINNDASFGYVRSLMRACTDRGWIAAGYNFRGCGGVPLTTPRGYTGSYTGDIRDAVQQICDRTASPSVPVFLVGNSLGANLITKYLGEEGYSGTLPPNVAGGVSLGNPLHIHSGNMSFPWAQVLGLGVRKSLFLTRDKWSQMTCRNFRAAFLKALLVCQTIGSVDDTLAPYLIRNDPVYPFAVTVGYPDAGEQYWDDASSYKYVQHVSVPLLKVTAQDDFLVYGSSLRKMSHCLECPNVTVVKTRCGGHLGWQESPPEEQREGEGRGFGTSSWADAAAADFIEAIIESRRKSDKEEEAIKKAREEEVEAEVAAARRRRKEEEREGGGRGDDDDDDDAGNAHMERRSTSEREGYIAARVAAAAAARREADEIRSRL